MNAVTKLRLGLIVIAGISMLAVILSVLAMRFVEREHQLIFRRELPLTIKLDRINMMSSEIAELAHRLSQTDDGPMRDLLGRRLAEKEAMFQETYDGILAIKPALKRSGLSSAINRIRALTRERETLNGIASEARSKTQTALAALLRANRTLLQTTEKLRSETGRKVRVPRATAGGVREMNGFRQAVLVHSLAKDLELDLALLIAVKSADEVAVAATPILRTLRELRIEIATLPHSPTRSELRDNAAGIEQLLQETPVFTQMRKSFEYHARIDALFTEIVSEITQLKSITARIAEASREAMLSDDSALSQKSARISTGLAIVGLLACALAIAVAVLVLERQLLHRLRRVHQNAQRIEIGDFSKQPDFAGADEIAALGRSIDRLRQFSYRQIEMETELRQARSAAEKLASDRSDFLATISHEVRTPLNAIIGLFELIERADIPERQKKRAVKGRQAGENLFNLLSNVLDASRMETSHLEMRIGTVHIRHLDNFIATTLEGAIAQSGKGLSGTFTIEGPVPDRFETDQYRVQQILTNLIDNAVRYTDSGEISVRLTARQEPECLLEFSVSDTGVGISEKEHDHIFERFQQSSPRAGTASRGSGLGLWISRELARLLDGKLTYQSALGVGTTFTLTIPCHHTRSG